MYDYVRICEYSRMKQGQLICGCSSADWSITSSEMKHWQLLCECSIVDWLVSSSGIICGCSSADWSISSSRVICGYSNADWSISSSKMILGKHCNIAEDQQIKIKMRLRNLVDQKPERKFVHNMWMNHVASTTGPCAKHERARVCVCVRACMSALVVSIIAVPL